MSKPKRQRLTEDQVRKFLEEKKLREDVFFCKILKIDLTYDQCDLRRSDQKNDCSACNSWAEIRKGLPGKPSEKPPKVVENTSNIFGSTFKEQEIIKIILHEVKNDKSYRQIANKINKLGYRNRNNSKFNASYVYNIYKNYYQRTFGRNPPRKKYIPKSKKVVQKTLSGEIIAIWISVAEAARVNDLRAKQISKCCRGMQNSSYGYIWEYLK